MAKKKTVRKSRATRPAKKNTASTNSDTAQAATKKRGPGISRDQSTAEPSRCRRCLSTKRSEYRRPPEVHHLSGIRDGKPFNRIEYRLTKCLDCGQHRRDISYHYSPKRD